MLRLARLITFILLAFGLLLCASSEAGAQNAQQKQAQLQKQLQQQKQQLQQQKNKNKNKNPAKVAPMFNVPVTPIVYPPNGLTPVKTVDKEVDYAVAEDAKVSRLMKFDTGLNYVEAALPDVVEGQLCTLSLIAKGDTGGKGAENVSGQVVKVSESGKLLTLRVTVPEGKDAPDGTGKEARAVAIRTAPAN